MNILNKVLLYIFWVFINSVSLPSVSSQVLCEFDHCDPLEIKQHFEEFGFGSIDILFGEEIILLNDSIGFNTRSSSDNNFINDFAKNLIKITDEFINLEEVLESVHSSDYIFDSFGDKIVYITDNDYLCTCHEETCSIIYEDFASKDIGFWFHLWRDMPSATQGKLYYGANLGYSSNDFSPTSDDHFTFIKSNLEEVIGELNTYGYASKESQVFSILSFSLLDLYDDRHNYSDAFDQDYQACHGGNCIGLLNEETYFLSPAGLPCNLQYNMKPNFGRRFAQSTLEGTLTGFHLKQDQQRVRGYHFPGSSNTFQGYRNTKSNKDYSDFYATSNENFKKVYTGFLSSAEDENFECNALILAPGSIDGGSSNEYGNGQKISSFEEAGYEFNTNSEAGLYENCIPKLSLEQLNSYHLNVKVLDAQSEITSIGVSYKMTFNGQEEVLHTYYNNDSPPSIEYLIWNEYSCSWDIFNPADDVKQDLDFYFAVILAFQEVTYDALTSHETWDLVAAAPGFGIPVDLANYVWYTIEDDLINAYFALGGVIVDIKVIKELGKYIIQFGSKVIRAISKKISGDPQALLLKNILAQFNELYPNEDASEIATEFVNFYLTLDDVILLKFISHPNLVKVWDEARKLGFDDVSKTVLLQELVDHPNLLTLFINNKHFVKSWDVFKNRPEIRLDETALTKMLEIANNPDLIEKFPDGIADLRKIGDVVIHPCCGGTHQWLEDITEHIDDIKYFLENFVIENNGYEKIISALKNVSPNMQDGISHVLTKLKSIDPPSTVIELEGKVIDADNLPGICQNCLFDIKVLDGTSFKKLELKSYKKSTIENISNSTQFRHQFKTYLVSINESVSEIVYIFNGNKPNIDIQLLKDNFKLLYEAGDYKIFDDLYGSQLFEIFEINSVDDFIDLVEDLDSPLYQFIEIL